MGGIKLRRFSTFDMDFVESKTQNAKVPENYPWVPGRLASALVYGLAVAFSSIYLPGFLHVRYENRKVLRDLKGGAFLYCNHTQPVGDVFLPALPVLPKRIYTVVSPANLGIPVLGRMLPFLGALPLPDSVKGMRRFVDTMEFRLNQGHPIAIFPEAHVWEYYTGIRPFGESAFKYPVKYNVASYAMTVTYQKRRLGKRPKAVVYIDGPFFGHGDTRKEQTRSLYEQVRGTMEKRSENSNCSYKYHYQRV